MSKTVTPSDAGSVEFTLMYAPQGKLEILTVLYKHRGKSKPAPFDLEAWRGPSTHCHRAIRATVAAQLEALRSSIEFLGILMGDSNVASRLALGFADLWWVLSRSGELPVCVTINVDSSDLAS